MSRSEPAGRRNRASERLLTEALASWPAPPAPANRDLVESADLDWLLRAAAYHGIEPALYVFLHDALSDRPPILETLKRSHVGQVIRHLQTMSDVQRLGTVLNAAEIPWVAVKGPVLAERYWRRPDLRRYSDLDIVVDRRRMSMVLGILEGIGARLIDVNWRMIYRDMRGELAVAMPSGTALDLHWDVVNERQLRHSLALRTDDMLTRRRLVSLGDSEVPTWDPCDTLLHTALHCAESGAHKLVWIKDVQLVLTDPELDWGSVVRRAIDGGVLLALAAVVERVERVFGRQPVPSDARRTLRRAGLWLGVTGTFDRLSPPTRQPSSRLSGRATFECIRSSTMQTGWEFLRHAKVVLDARRHPSSDATNPLHVPDGDAEAKAAYLRFIETDPRP